jgi:hypothetical protein
LPRPTGNITARLKNSTLPTSTGTRRAQVAADGTRVFIRDGRIEGEAPELPQVDIDI